MEEKKTLKELLAGNRRNLAVVLCAIITVLASAKGYQISETDQAAIVDTIIALLSSLAGGLALVSKIAGMKDGK